MASEVDICNLALGHLGDSATVSSISPPEGSAQADHCARFYPIARDTLLEMAPWPFSARRIAASKLVNDRAEWGFAYALPNQALRILGVFPAAAKDDAESLPFVRELNSSNVEAIYTDCENAVLQYTVSVPDTSKFTPMFLQTLSWHLASMLAGPVIKGDAGQAEAKRCAQMMLIWLGKAQTSSINQRRNPMTYIPAHLAAR